MDRSSSALMFVAVDGGAREALAPVAAHCRAALADVAPGAAENAAYWRDRFAALRPRVLVAGTSDSVRGRAVEGAARRAARGAGVHVAAIEDFPGNYYDVEGGDAELVLVESAAARALCVRKLGARAPRVEIASPARYDKYRSQLEDARRRTAQRWAASQAPAVLWTGQPETDDGLRTLAALLPLFRERAIELVFKAHPRDPGYAAGAYHAVLDSAAVSFVDLTHATVEETLAFAPRLVVTQFSSTAIEAGFFGIPSLWVLLPEAGGARLLQKKGYAVPPLCLAGAAACATDMQLLAATITAALDDRAYRESLMRCFDDYYNVREFGAAHSASLLAAFATSK